MLPSKAIAEPGGPASGPEDNYALHRSKKRQRTRAHIHAQVLHPIDTPNLLRDPLYHPSSPIDSTISILKLLVAAAAIHGAIILVFSVVNGLMGDSGSYQANERVVVNIVETPKKLLAPPEEEEEEEGPVVPDFEKKVEVAKVETPKPDKKIEKPKKKPKTKKVETAPPVAAPGPVTADPAPQARRRIGTSFESTVTGGKGPAFATGTSRMGATSTTAVDPKIAAKKSAGTSTKTAGSGGGGGESREQRVASHIPTQGSTFIKPKRAKPSKPPYPATLKAQRIEGNVQVRVSIDAKGKVTKVTVIKGSGHAAFDEAARTAAMVEIFKAATKDGKPVPFTLSYSYRFRIEEK